MNLECRSSTELLLIRSATYGRMRPGRCVSSHYAEALGCRADVTYHVDGLCTGRRECSLLVAAIDSIQQPCAKDFKMYLEVDYDCVQVSYLTDCRHGNTTIVTQSFGYLALLPGPEAPRSPWQPSQQQQQQQPPPNPRICSWTIVTERGRGLVVAWKAFRTERRLVPSNGRHDDGRQGDGGRDVGRHGDGRQGDDRQRDDGRHGDVQRRQPPRPPPPPRLQCPVVLAFWDGRDETLYPVCPGGGSPSSSVPTADDDPAALDPVVFSSKGSWIELKTSVADWSFLVGPPVAATGASGPPTRKPFILQYQAVGCADLVMEGGEGGTAAAVSRHGSDVTVDCPSTQEKWFLRCQDGVWIGDMGNCSAIDQGQRSSEVAVTFSAYEELRNGIIVSILIGIVLGIATGSALMLLIHLLKTRNKRRRIFKERPLTSTSDLYKMPRGAVPGCTSFSNICSRTNASVYRPTAHFPLPPPGGAYVCACAPAAFNVRSDYDAVSRSRCLLRGREVELPSDVMRRDLLTSPSSSSCPFICGNACDRVKDDVHVCGVHVCDVTPS